MTHTHTQAEDAPWTFTFADRLQKALRVADMSIEDMAETLDISRNTVGSYLAGKTVPSRLATREWAARTGVPLEWLLTGAEATMAPAPTRRRAGAAGLSTFVDIAPRLGLEPRTCRLTAGCSAN